MASTIILSDNGASSGSAGLKQTAGNDGVLILQTTTSGGTATNAVLVDNTQNVLIGMASYGVTNAGVSLSPTASSSFYVAGGTAVTIGRGASNGTAVQFNRSGTNVGTIDVATTGLTMTGTNGITFTAAQTASTDANTLDDYEEGTFTPTFSPASGSWTTSSAKGFYTKIGNVVALRMYLTITTVGTGSGVINVSGLPFAGFNPSVGGGNRSAIGVVREDAAVGFMAQIYLDGNATTGGMQATGGGAIGQASGYVYDITVTYCTST